MLQEMNANQSSVENKTYDLYPPEKLINKNEEELPEGACPTEREVRSTENVKSTP